MARRGGLHRGGYSVVTASKMAAVEVPEKIRCSACNKVKGFTQYSKKQVNDLRFKILQFGPISGTNGAYIKCRGCTGQVVTEMTCAMCDEVKGLESFAKTQRGDPDNARCTNCVNDHQCIDPGFEDEEKEDDSDTLSNPYGNSDHDDNETDGGVVMGLDKLQLSHTAPTDSVASESENLLLGPSKAGTSIVADPIDSATNAWVTWASKAGRESAAAADATPAAWATQSRRVAKTATTFRGWDSHGVAHSRLHAPSTTASQLSYTPEDLRTFPRAKPTSAFPKVNAVARPAPPRQHQKGYTVPADEDEDDSDDDYMTL